MPIQREGAFVALLFKQAWGIVSRAIAAGERDSVKIAAVVVDQGGHVVAAARMDGVGFVSGLQAIRKAVASATFGAPTHAVGSFASGDPALVAALHAESAINILPGGLPIIADGICVGALGVAGGHYAQDQAVAEAALADASVHK